MREKDKEVVSSRVMSNNSTHRKPESQDETTMEQIMQIIHSQKELMVMNETLKNELLAYQKAILELTRMKNLLELTAQERNHILQELNRHFEEAFEEQVWC